VSSKAYPLWVRPAKHGPLCPSTSGRRPFLSFHHQQQQRAKSSRGFEKNKTQFVGSVSWECIFTAGKIKKVLRAGVLEQSSVIKNWVKRQVLKKC
jgi:hypothetical protein